MGLALSTLIYNVFYYKNNNNNNDNYDNYNYLENSLIYYNKMVPETHDVKDNTPLLSHTEDNLNFNFYSQLPKCYNLYIYIEPDVPSHIKQNYIDNSHKHNLIIDSYYNSLNSDNSDNDSTCFDSGFDLFCPTDNITYGTQSLILDHKVKCCMKCNNRYVGYYLYSRSSTASKTPLRLANSVGVIDSGYRGNIIAMFDNIKDYDFMEYDVVCGHRYVQICPPNLEYPMKVYIVDNETDLGKQTIRGNGGFGSTGN